MSSSGGGRSLSHTVRNYGEQHKGRKLLMRRASTPFPGVDGICERSAVRVEHRSIYPLVSTMCRLAVGHYFIKYPILVGTREINVERGYRALFSWVRQLCVLSDSFSWTRPIQRVMEPEGNPPNHGRSQCTRASRVLPRGTLMELWTITEWAILSIR